MSGLPRQFMEMELNMRCSIQVCFEMPGKQWSTVMASPVFWRESHQLTLAERLDRIVQRSSSRRVLEQSTVRRTLRGVLLGDRRHGYDHKKVKTLCFDKHRQRSLRALTAAALHDVMMSMVSLEPREQLSQLSCQAESPHRQWYVSDTEQNKSWRSVRSLLRSLTKSRVAPQAFSAAPMFLKARTIWPPTSDGAKVPVFLHRHRLDPPLQQLIQSW